ncbi:hypothetical protein JCGZ_00333 [Jatropha curcas]|uniref:Uncharacterized protein n=1 Tax=Jatropha curcas TaxID=180498 RepID=A0A067JUI7_JATCU|nr:hypothetical protein JCGZ_00333 [Jatropha curcas]
MAAENIADWLPEGAVVDPITQSVCNCMKLREFIQDTGNSINLRLDLPTHLCWGTNEKSVKHEKSGGNAYAAGEWFDRLPILVQDRVRKASFRRFAHYHGLPFGGRSIMFNNQLRTLDQVGLRASLRVAIGMKSTISDKRVQYESIIPHFEKMPPKRVEEMDVNLVARAVFVSPPSDPKMSPPFYF